MLAMLIMRGHFVQRGARRATPSKVSLTDFVHNDNPFAARAA